MSCIGNYLGLLANLVASMLSLSSLVVGTFVNWLGKLVCAVVFCKSPGMLRNLVRILRYSLVGCESLLDLAWFSTSVDRWELLRYESVVWLWTIWSWYMLIFILIAELAWNKPFYRIWVGDWLWEISDVVSVISIIHIQSRWLPIVFPVTIDSSLTD